MPGKSRSRRQADVGGVDAVFEEEEEVRQPGLAATKVPLPRQPTFSGDTPWQAFYQVFLSLGKACRWSDEEKRIRLLSAVTGEAADYLFRTQPTTVFESFSSLSAALANRFEERAAPNSFVSKLESRKLMHGESLAVYVADLQRFTLRGFPTADEATREQIALRQFLRGIQDQNLAMAVGMQEPSNLSEAQDLVDRYRSITDEQRSSVKVRPVAQGAAAPTIDDKLADLETKMAASIDAKIDGLVDKLAGKLDLGGGRSWGERRGRGGGRGSGNYGNRGGYSGRGRGREGSVWGRCYNCGEPGHHRHNCPHPPQQEN